MIISVEFDRALAAPHAYAAEEVRLRQSAVNALVALRRAGHVLIVTSPRSNLAARVDPSLNPLVRAGAVRIDPKTWAASRETHSRRYTAMLRALKPLGALIAAVDDGAQGPLLVDMAITGDTVVNGRSMATEPRRAWAELALTYGDVGLSDVA